MKRAAIILFILIASLSRAQQPTPAPRGSLLVTRICAVADVRTNARSKRFLNEGIQDIGGASLACHNAFNENSLLVSGEFRLFMHLIGATEEYDVSCLGHIKWVSGWGTMGDEHFEFDKPCVIPHGRHGYWLNLGWGCNGGQCASFALPEVGSYIPTTWKGDNLTLRFVKDYHDTVGMPITFSIVHRMNSTARIMAPGETIVPPPSCANGEINVQGKQMCRPE
jgi:hypothetical protein